MTTNTAGTQSRQDPRQVTNTIRFQTSTGASAAMTTTSGLQIGVLPQGAFITEVTWEVSTVFTGSPTFGVGTDGPPSNIITAGAVTNATTPLQSAAAKLGRVHAASADSPIFIKFSATAAAGVLDVVIEYEGNFPG